MWSGPGSNESRTWEEDFPCSTRSAMRSTLHGLSLLRTRREAARVSAYSPRRSRQSSTCEAIDRMCSPSTACGMTSGHGTGPFARPSIEISYSSGIARGGSIPRVSTRASTDLEARELPRTQHSSSSCDQETRSSTNFRDFGDPRACPLIDNIPYYYVSAVAFSAAFAFAAAIARASSRLA